jgi:hypothetical protein
MTKFTKEESERQLAEIMFEPFDHPAIKKVVEGPGYHDITLKTGVKGRIYFGTIDPNDGTY